MKEVHDSCSACSAKRNSSSRALAGILSNMADCMSIMSIFPGGGGTPNCRALG